MKPTEIEKQNLEAHVEICAVRYASLETKLDNLEHRIDKVELHLIDIKDRLVASLQPQQQQSKADAPKENADPYKTMIAIGTTIIGVLITGIITLLVKLY
jgi:LPS O-antigen subunit length determinant protein (WzzB/FepE family)